MNRRHFLVQTGALAGFARLNAALTAAQGRPAEELASDDTFWIQIRQAFTIDTQDVALNAGANNATPRTVAEAWQHYTAFTNLGPLVNRRILSSQRDSVRARIAGLIRRPPTEVALTRNTTEGLNIVIGGYRLERGDEIVATDHEYPNTMNALRQRAARDGVRLTLASMPIAPTSSNAVAEAIQSVLSARTKLLVTPHIADPTGQLLPVSALARLARARGIAYLVDGALGFGTVDVDLSEISCDFYATSLHKGLHGPLGTGFLYVKQERIPALWPLFAAERPDSDDVRKFEAVGTQPLAQIAALTQALDFMQMLGVERIRARLHWLKRYWTDQVSGLPGVRFHTSLDWDQSVAITLMEIAGIEPQALYDHLLVRDRIRAWPIVAPRARGLWVAPFFYTIPRELDVLVGAVRRVAQGGLG